MRDVEKLNACKGDSVKSNLADKEVLNKSLEQSLINKNFDHS